MSHLMRIMCSLSSQKEVHLESLVKNLNETLTSVRRDCNIKDDLVAYHEKRAQEAIAGDYWFSCLHKCLFYRFFSTVI